MTITRSVPHLERGRQLRIRLLPLPLQLLHALLPGHPQVLLESSVA